MCRTDGDKACLPDLAICTAAPSGQDSTCAIANAEPGRSYTVQATACPDALCSTGVKSKQSLLAGAPTFETPYP